MSSADFLKIDALSHWEIIRAACQREGLKDFDTEKLASARYTSLVCGWGKQEGPSPRFLKYLRSQNVTDDQIEHMYPEYCAETGAITVDPKKLELQEAFDEVRFASASIEIATQYIAIFENWTSTGRVQYLFLLQKLLEHHKLPTPNSLTKALFEVTGMMSQSGHTSSRIRSFENKSYREILETMCFQIYALNYADSFKEAVLIVSDLSNEIAQKPYVDLYNELCKKQNKKERDASSFLFMMEICLMPKDEGVRTIQRVRNVVNARKSLESLPPSALRELLKIALFPIYL